MNVRACDFPETIEYEPNLGALLDRHPELQIERDDYNINVTANYGERLEPDALFERYKRHPGRGKPAHLYYHFPLCEYICHFCNYVKQLASPTSRDAQLDRWTDALIKESTLYAQQVPWITGALIESFYIGGGTAAVLTPAHLLRILDHVRSTFHVTPECELNIEGNPDNFCDIDKVRALSDIGFNRFSVGVQSFTPEVNQFTNRGHTPDMRVRPRHRPVRRRGRLGRRRVPRQHRTTASVLGRSPVLRRQVSCRLGCARPGGPRFRPGRRARPARQNRHARRAQRP